MTLNARAWFSLFALAVAMGLMLFVPAGTVRYWQGWLFLAIFVGASALTTLDLMHRDPALLGRRLRGGPTAEQRPAQKIIMRCVSIGFAALLVVPALDHRLGWSRVPWKLVGAGDVLVLAGFAAIFRIYRENTFTSATVEVTEQQRVISTGPYAIVRHPMYASAMVYLLGMPLALASYWGFVPVATMFPFLIWRLLDEERLLVEQLPGYADYRQKVRFRLLPRIW